eukprot:gnl/MRDRNA2_/MRDRNA2_75666_c0_seq1.p1 gnl/MRDRNA2_/MRDRNA2_75666_c0~~gnl/MRDRNA2_/MRDRNA2_75666_c0_seq1.p1  ORF type:complete len:690 (-),score=158.56 gnl/MRDRNA2_/MRDRNA2_75666_c0_seq1:741-2573(-)
MIAPASPRIKKAEKRAAAAELKCHAQMARARAAERRAAQLMSEYQAEVDQLRCAQLQEQERAAAAESKASQLVHEMEQLKASRTEVSQAMSHCQEVTNNVKALAGEISHDKEQTQGLRNLESDQFQEIGADNLCNDEQDANLRRKRKKRKRRKLARETCGNGRRKKSKPKLAELKNMSNVEADVEDLKNNHESPQNQAFGDDASSNPLLQSGVACLEILKKKTVLVAIRVRPLNKKEFKTGSTGHSESIRHDSTTSLTLQRMGEKDSTFAFDCVFPQGICQQDVFDRTGRPLLHKVLEGYNGCLFAYGQTGSGKTFTMHGEGLAEHRGVIPLLCSDLFREIKDRSATKRITVSCSVLEIYNERLRDLLSHENKDLHIREDNAAGGRGIFVDGLSEKSVQTVQEVLTFISKAEKRRRVGETNMNEHSSRSHTVVTLCITMQDEEDADGLTLTVSKLHLVDLAGSERQKATNAVGERLKEGAQINLALSALGKVIKALTDPQAPGQKQRHVPYRDSKLTRILQDSLGGNSYTVMICNVSPAQINADETLSSLRFAERAKKIENEAIVNRDPKTQRFLELAKENKALQEKIAQLESHISRLEDNYDKNNNPNL